MSKPEVLEYFARSNAFITPDHVWLGLKPRPDRRSVYSYLLRLKRQGLLETGPNVRRGNLAYRLTQRGHARLKYFRSQSILRFWGATLLLGATLLYGGGCQS